jgi:hypothetical protein
MTNLTQIQKQILETSLEVRNESGAVDYTEVRKKIKAKPGELQKALKDLKEGGLIIRGRRSRWYRVTRTATIKTIEKPQRLPRVKIDQKRILGHVSKIASLAFLVVSLFFTYNFFSVKNPDSTLVNVFLSFGIVAGVYLSWTIGTMMFRRREKSALLFFFIWLCCFSISFLSTLVSQRITYNAQTADTKETVMIQGIQEQKDMIDAEIKLILSEMKKLGLEQDALSDWDTRKKDFAYNNTNMIRTDKSLARMSELREEKARLILQEASVTNREAQKVDFYSFIAGRFGWKPEWLFLAISMIIAIIIDMIGPMFLAGSYLWEDSLGGAKNGN